MRRKSSPSSFEQIEGAQGHGAAVLLPADQVEYCKSLLVTGDGLAVDYAGACRQGSNRRGGQREAASEIVALPGEKPHPIAVALGHDAEAVMLDFVKPIRPSRRLVRQTWQARLNEVG
jgi:hypothetical protein